MIGITAFCLNFLGSYEGQHLVRFMARSQFAKPFGRHGWVVKEEEVVWKASETAIIVVDMWDRHWSRGATERVNLMVHRANEIINLLRNKGVTIIHAPSGTMDFYKDHIAKKRAMEVPYSKPPEPLEHDDPPLPVDASDGGSDTGEVSPYIAYSRQHPVIEIKDSDYISDDGQEIYNILAYNHIRNLIFIGVHTNMCILGRPFAIKQMVRWGFNVVLVRDLTDAMYNPYRPPYVSHEEGTNLVIGYIEKFWCPTIHSSDLTTPDLSPSNN